MYCSNCGKLLTEETFCPQCGTPTNKEEIVQTSVPDESSIQLDKSTNAEGSAQIDAPTNTEGSAQIDAPTNTEVSAQTDAPTNTADATQAHAPTSTEDTTQTGTLAPTYVSPPSSAYGVPSEIKRWNWGAFTFNIFWGIGNHSYLPLLCFVPLLNLVWVFVCGAKGNEWAWKSGKFNNVEEFLAVQETWNRAGFVSFILSAIVFSLYIIFFILLLTFTPNL